MAGVELQVYKLDAFTDQPFKGNPAVVCPISAGTELQDETMQKIAVEFNLTTAFIRLLEKSDTFTDSSTFGLRWFTTKTEIKLCGHATLTSAAVLFSKIGNKHTSITFKTQSGDLIVKRQDEYIHMDFPVAITVKEDRSQHEDLIKALGDIPGVSDIAYSDSLRYLLVRLQDGWSKYNGKEFETWAPNNSALKASTDRLLILIVTTRGPPGEGYQTDNGVPYDFVSRCFGPWINISEDPVTGSAQTLLAHYWSQQLGKTEFYVRQCSSRGGELGLKLNGDRVELRGKAAFVMDGVLKF